MDLGVLLSLPVESIAIRAVLATVLCVALARMILRIGVRSPTIRVVIALAPAAVLLTVALAASTHLRLPQLFVPVEGGGVLPIRVADGYLDFAPMELPLLIGLWALVAVVRVVRRSGALRTARRRAERAVTVGEVPGDVRSIALRVAADLDVPAPTVTVVPACPGGAYVVGARHPIVVLDRQLVGSLDAHELEGVLAHELAHVRRRDNAVAAVLGVVRDLAFFVPGIGWAARQLHRERELAADQVAVGVTRRPGALASGLLKVLEDGPSSQTSCAALAPHGSLVDRVTVLVDDRPPPSRTRRGLELSTVATIVAVSVVMAMTVPTLLAGPDRQRDAVALVWSSSTSPGADGMAAGAEARAFDVYRRTSIDDVQPRSSGPMIQDEQATAYRRSTLHACREDGAFCPAADEPLGLGLQPRPVITVDTSLTAQWQATPVVRGARGGEAEGFQVYWLSLRD